jgi:methylmalonyl-CoA mutase, N-terminal domain
VSHEVERSQREALSERRRERSQGTVDAALRKLVEAARADANLVPIMLEAARAEATLGEICGALRSEWGDYHEPARF